MHFACCRFESVEAKALPYATWRYGAYSVMQVTVSNVTPAPAVSNVTPAREQHSALTVKLNALSAARATRGGT